ncbi:unnamed protein product [Rotaria magnacalcarata]|uniref:RBR-type E3 ubiquitin transferase n=1 Tax=Rotaria magnacalcarata TaxID=392030 RepID=A0A815LTK7_9BILA|nr:unnamed protein product [Rotaria magnacalcarata]CAF1407468.1 unnamed protein product [Rotaria magnacalcarata]CAF2093433.1 unnamed protein product [Rotaria magnacalcarata]CAF3864709.1 unnamed protein product [Rotaria magnacalcarata]
MSNSAQQEATVSPSVNHHDAKQWQHCSLFNLDIFHDDTHHLNLTKNIINNKNIVGCCCSASTPNVDDSCGKKHLNHSCSYVVIQKNYTTQLEHVAETLLADENKTSNDCYYCSNLDTNDTKTQSFNRKILLGSTAILDSLLRNNLKTSAAITYSNNTPTTNVTSTGNQRRWHSERGSRHPNVRANLPLTSAQRQVLERYMNYPLIKPPTTLHSTHRLRNQALAGKAGEATGTALSALAEQPTASSSTMVHPRKNSVPSNHTRPLSSTSSSTSPISHHSTLNRRFLTDTIKSQENSDEENDDDDDKSISSELDPTIDEEHSDINPTIILPNHHTTLCETLSECSICCEMKRLQKRACCNFYACSTCLNIYIEEQIKRGIVRIQCPNQQCRIYMHRDEIYKRCISPELRQKFTRFLVDVNRANNIKTCPRCSNIHEIDPEVFRTMRRAPTKVQCVECNLIWCFQCHSPWHDGIQCKEFRRGDRMLKKWAREVHYGQHNAQQCPSCKVYIQRTKGCDHIVCLRCKTEFCYKCGGRFRDIKFIGDHYSELSVLGCKYRFYPDHPFKRRLIRGSILCGKILAAPIVLCLAAVAGAVCVGVGLPAYCCFMLVRHVKAKRRRPHSKLKEPVLMSYKTLNDMVPQLIPRDPLNSDGIKPGFNSIRSNIQINETINIDIDPTSNAPIAVFDECDIHIPTRQTEESTPMPITSLSSTYLSMASPSFPRLTPYTTLRRSPSKINI